MTTNSEQAQASPTQESRVAALARHRSSLIAHAVVVVALLVLQPFLSLGVVSVLMLCAVYGIYALGYEILFGFTNQCSLGQSLFFGAGAYTVALLVERIHMNFLLAVLSAIALGIVLGIVVGYLTVRLTEAYFVITTALFATVVNLVATDMTWLTGGSNGLPFEIPPVHVGGLELSVYNNSVLYYGLILTVFAVYLILRIIKRSKLGLVFMAIKENEGRVPFVGYNLFRYKWLAFIMSAAVTALGGALYALRLRYVSVDFLGFEWSVIPVVWVLLGGSGTVVGPLLGVVVMVLFEYYVSAALPSYLIVIGLLLMILMRWSPGGLMGYLSRIPEVVRRAVSREVSS